MLNLNCKEHAGFMLDIETDGLSPILNSITSVGLVAFNLDTFVVNAILAFKFKPGEMPLRISNPDTVTWRKDNNVDDMESDLPGVPVRVGLRSISNFMDNWSTGRKSILFSKHIDFDAAFLRGYYDVKGFKFPFKHRNVYDIDSIILGSDIDPKGIYANTEKTIDKKLKFYASYLPEKKSMPSRYAKHSAIYDCVFQIELLNQLQIAKFNS